MKQKSSLHLFWDSVRIEAALGIEKPNLSSHPGPVAWDPSNALVSSLLMVLRPAGLCQGLSWYPGGVMPERKTTHDTPFVFLLPRALGLLSYWGRWRSGLSPKSSWADKALRVRGPAFLTKLQGDFSLLLTLWPGFVRALFCTDWITVCTGVPSKGLQVARLQPLPKESAFIHSFICSFVYSFIHQSFVNIERFRCLSHVLSAQGETKLDVGLPSRNLQSMSCRTRWWELMVPLSLLEKGTRTGGWGRGWGSFYFSPCLVF